LQQAIGQRTFSVIDVGYDAEISDILHRMWVNMEILLFDDQYFLSCKDRKKSVFGEYPSA